jgi:hypothetical protein
MRRQISALSFHLNNNKKRKKTQQMTIEINQALLFAGEEIKRQGVLNARTSIINLT